MAPIAVKSLCRLAATVLMALLAYPAAAAPDLLGDLDEDQVFTANDLAILVGHSAGTHPLPSALQPFADLTQDGFVNDADHTALISLILETSTPQSLPLATVREMSPSSGEGDVAVTRETVLYFSMPLALNAAIDTNKLKGEFGGRKILSRVEISSDRKKATLFYLEPLPSNARIQVSFDSTGVNDLLGRAVDGDGDAQPGGLYQASFDTLSITPVAGTAISGRVFASERGTGGNEVPLAGVTVTVDGAEEMLRTVTDALGNFTLSPCPAGTFFVHVDGRTSPASSWPNGDYYPVVGKRWDALAGRPDNLSGNSQDTSRGTIFLPKVLGAALTAVSASEETPVELPASITAANPAFAGTRLTIPANSLFADDGTRGGSVGVAPVAPDRLPSPLPPGLNLPMVITIQTDGGTNFDRPVPVTFPNLPDPVTGEKLPAGAKSALWSFNHDLGDWEVVGPMTVSEDGNFVVSDAGVGVRQPGWHGSVPGAQLEMDAPLLPRCEAGARAAQAFHDSSDAAMAVASHFGSTYQAAADIVNVPLRSQTPTYGKLMRGAKYFDKFGTLYDLKDCLLEGDGDSCIGFGTTAAKFLLTRFAPRLALGPVGLLLTIAEVAIAGVEAYQAMTEAEDSIRIAASELEKCIGTNLPSQVQQRFDDAREQFLRVRDEAALQHEALSKAAQAFQDAQDLLPQPLPDALPPDLVEDLGIPIQIGLDEFEPLLDRPYLPGLIPDLFRKYDDARGAGEKLIQRPPGFPVPKPPQVTGMYFVLIQRLNFEDRFRMKPGNLPRRVLAANTEHLISIYAANEKLIGSAFFVSSADGTIRNIGSISLIEDKSVDTDGDGLSNRAEKIIGCNPAKEDSDDDGITDGAEVRQGTDPMSGLLVQTGVVASALLPGPAIDVAAANGIAAVAHGATGVTFFNVGAGTNPLRFLQLDTQGFAQAVSLDRSFALVADAEAGVQILDLADAAAVLPSLTSNISVGSRANAVATAGITGYVGTQSGHIVVLDLAARRELSRIALPSGISVEDLQIEGDKLYALQSNALRVLAIDGPNLSLQGSRSLSLQRSNMQLRFRLFVGNGLAYATHSRGYEIIDVSNPAAPTLVRSHTDNQFGWKQMVQNGSGLGLACAGPNGSPDGAHHLNLYNVGTDGRGSDFLTTIETPGIATAVSVYNGLAYVADGAAGLQVINYRAFDTLKQAPTIQLTSNINLQTPMIEEGKRVRFTAAVTDDVQVRNVEFHVDGELRTTDGNFPFEHSFTAPALSAGSLSFKVKAKATDTGGNFAWSQEYTITLTSDFTKPSVVNLTPANNSLTGALASLFATFSEPMNDASLAGNVILKEAGVDKLIGTADDVTATREVSYRDSTRTAFMTFDSAGLPPGLYRLTIQAPAADIAGNTLASTAVSNFRIFNAALDLDVDGVPDEYEPLIGLNPTKADTDNDGIPDGMEDFDNDGLNNTGEFLLGTNPAVADSNGNGIPDGFEDQDNDGLRDGLEALAGTNVLVADSDADGYYDADEIAEGADPKSTNSRPLIRTWSPGAAYLNVQSGDWESAVLPVVSPAASYLNAPATDPERQGFITSPMATYKNGP